jgi:phospholipid/cholesterol/gamma-HCH transport system permease protein
MADAVGVLSGYMVGTLAANIPPADFKEGVRLAFGTFQVVYSLLKATMFGAAIALNCAYEGYVTGAGAEGVVITSVTILVLDALTAAVLAPYLQA